MSTLQQAFAIRDAQIRVVDILPGSVSDPITLECRIIDLDRLSSSYEALSYVWGDAVSKRVVDISGHKVEITQTLHTAFQELRNAQTRRTLWVDQVSINQSDDTEKAHQVELMRTIYKLCSQCLIWLGRIPTDQGFSTLDAEVALDFLHMIADRETYAASHEYERYHPLVADNERGERARKAFRALVLGGNPWWSRVWTLQEASLPLAATLHWGSLTISLETIEDAAKTMCSGWFCNIATERIAADFRDLTSNFLYPVRGLSIARLGETPLDTLMRWRYRKATDSRDKVYGLVGLIAADTLAGIPALRDVSYSISPAVLFARVTLDLIKFTEDLRPLVGARELPHVTPGNPTWAIDFASCSAIGQRQTRWWQHSHRYLRWMASKGLNSEFQVSGDETSLFLSGKFIDEVDKVSGVYTVSAEEEISDERLRESIIQSYIMLEEYQASRGSDLDIDYVGGGGTLRDAFWRTVLGNLVMEEMPRGVPMEHDMRAFEDYVNDGKHGRLTLSLHGFVPNHAFFITKMGYIGVGPSDLRERDWICVFVGGKVPFVVRSEAVEGMESVGLENCRFHLLGDAYVHGTMRGETIKRDEELSIIQLV
ncbi:HET-domain-containing protein [Byssothecium circinans]|uniref:HET-domain-containing protein n=1 Tax=Byssothecium circinans TaxID=147558 RepID=A0A6A5TF60_9PLEO|nr:HET-domain-containing protein [Byssothecium circinans]